MKRHYAPYWSRTWGNFKKVTLELDDDSAQKNGSETDDAVQFEDSKDSGSEYVPTDADSRDEYSPLRAKK